MPRPTEPQDVSLPRDVAIRLREIEAVFEVRYAIAKAQWEGKAPADADDLLERADALIRDNVARDADVLAAWFRSSALGQQTSFAIGQAIADEDAVQERPALFEAMKEGYWAYQTWSDRCKWDETGPAIVVDSSEELDAYIKDTARRLGVTDLGAATSVGLYRLEAERLAEEPYNAQARVAIRLAVHELSRYFLSQPFTRPSASPPDAGHADAASPDNLSKLLDGTVVKTRSLDGYRDPVAPEGAGLV